MKTVFLSLFFALLLLLLNTPTGAEEELYIITTRDGSATVVREYRFTGEYIEFTTENGLPGFIKRTELVRIDNMIGVSAGGTDPAGEKEMADAAVSPSWAFSGAILVSFIILFVYFLSRKKPAYTGREKEQRTSGHLSFDYREVLGRTSRWTIDVRRAYEEGGILYIEGICTTTDKKRTFRADRVIGPVTDVSNDKKAPMEGFFIDA